MQMQIFYIGAKKFVFFYVYYLNKHDKGLASVDPIEDVR